jgi:hypothetical protein
MRIFSHYGFKPSKKTQTHNFLDEGLHKEGTSLQQIPTYVTGVPNGTEKVIFYPHLAREAAQTDSPPPGSVSGR